MLGRRGVLRFLALLPYVWLALFLVVLVGLIAIAFGRAGAVEPMIHGRRRSSNTSASSRRRLSAPAGHSALMAGIVALTATVLPTLSPADLSLDAGAST
jgi:hypothetical protein